MTPPITDSRRKVLHLFLLALFLFPATATATPNATSSKAGDDELQILLKLKSVLQQSNPDAFASWQPTNAKCEFAGIACGPDGFVTEIELSGRGLSGEFLPVDDICNLRSLERLSLGSNRLRGRISEGLNRCVGLRYLDLGNNNFTGPIPHISSLSGLTQLYLNHSGFSGPFPWKSLDNMTGLTALSLGDNPFDPSPFPAEVLKLYKLDWLYLSVCNLEGRVPQGLGNLSGLRELEFASNNLSGELPPDLVKLVNLWQLILFNNSFTGKFPAGMGNLVRLESFDASMNKLEGDLSELRLLTNLVSVQLYKNNFTGEVPAEFGDFRRLVNLSLYTNRLTGTLPSKLGSWANFNFIDVSENFFTGPIPPDMCKQGTMKMLLMLQNRFTGEIPAAYANCPTLQRFRVNSNSLTGVVPAGLWALPQVIIIDLRVNQFEGPITSDIAGAKSLRQLYVANNRLSGELPPEISQASNLLAIDVSNNQFSGEIPGTIGDLKTLATLHLEGNSFSGPIPKSLGYCDTLTDVDISHNSISGEIPASLASLPVLNSLNLSRNKLSGRIPAKLSSVVLSLLDLSYNRLTGPIPPSFAHAYEGGFVGNAGLCSFNLSSFRRCNPGSGGMSKVDRALIGSFAAALAGLLLVLACFVRQKRREHRRRNGAARSLRDNTWDVKSYQVLTFTEEQILDAIRQENLIGKGGSGNVYRVSLPDGVDLAVKHIWNSDSGGRGRRESNAPMLGRGGGVRSREFDAEVQALSSVRHMNVVKLYCSITSEDSSLLVYEYMPNGSLWDRMHTGHKMELDWIARYEIAVGAARGLEYLHHGCERPMIHRDVKSSNILLDQHLKPRIADFGLAKIVHPHVAKDSTQSIAGTPGYMAPEYGYRYKVNEKIDVYSFGVVLMELVTGKRPIDPEFREDKGIVNWVSRRLHSRESVLSMVDEAIPQGLKEEAVKVLRISIMCTARLPERRPTMREVVKMLAEADPCNLVGVVIHKDGTCQEQEVVVVNTQ